MPNLSAKSQKGKTYVIIAKDVRKFKIGSATNQMSRLGNLQVGSPVQLKMILDLLPVPEAVFHNDNGLKKYRSHGEWYDLTKESVDEFYRVFRENTKPGSRYIGLRYALCELEPSAIKRCSEYAATIYRRHSCTSRANRFIRVHV